MTETDEDMVQERRSTVGDKRKRLPPKEESSIWKGSAVHGKSQVETEGELKTERNSRPTKDEKEVVSQRLTTNDVVKDKTDDSRVANTTSRVEEGFGNMHIKTWY